MSYWRGLGLLAAAILVAGCAPRASDETAAVYTGGDILTLAGETPSYVEALAVRDGKIVAAGSQSEARKAAGPGARTVDLKGGVLLPGFIDSHSHILTYADSLTQANLTPPPVGGVTSIPDILAELKRLKDSLKAGPGVLLVGQGYDPDFLAEKRHPTAADLDAVFPDNPVILMHASGHMLVANTAAIRKAGVSAATPDPEGGAILRKPGSREPEGLFQEIADVIIDNDDGQTHAGAKLGFLSQTPQLLRPEPTEYSAPAEFCCSASKEWRQE